MAGLRAWLTAPARHRAVAALTLLYSSILIVLAVIPRLDNGGVEVSDIVLHGVAYGGSGLLFGWLLRFGRPNRAIWWRAVLLAWSLGLVTELLQLLAPTRSFQFSDLIADLIGSMAGALVAVVAFGAGRAP